FASPKSISLFRGLCRGVLNLRLGLRDVLALLLTAALLTMDVPGYARGGLRADKEASSLAKQYGTLHGPWLPDTPARIPSEAQTARAVGSGNLQGSALATRVSEARGADSAVAHRLKSVPLEGGVAHRLKSVPLEGGVAH